MARFFQISGRVSEAELIDILLHRYGGAYEVVLNYSPSRLVKLLAVIHEKKNEQRMWELYKVNFGRMSKDNFESYEDYKRRVSGATIDRRPDREIIAEIEEIRAQFEQKED